VVAAKGEFRSADAGPLGIQLGSQVRSEGEQAGGLGSLVTSTEPAALTGRPLMNAGLPPMIWPPGAFPVDFSAGPNGDIAGSEAAV
jgi:hypothetical protein